MEYFRKMVIINKHYYDNDKEWDKGYDFFVIITFF